MKVYKYKPFNMHALELLLRDELYLAEAQTLNDPVDCVLVYKGEHHPLEAIVCSLSESNDNFAMWSQYTDGHRGLCYELDYTAITSVVQAKNALNEQQKVILFDRVEYLDSSDFQIAIAKAVKEQPGGLMAVDYEKIVMLKIDTFAHEKEVRIAMKSIHIPRIPILSVPDVVVGVYMGLKIQQKHREMLEAIVDMVNGTRSRKIKKYSAKSVDEHYRITFEEVG